MRVAPWDTEPLPGAGCQHRPGSHDTEVSVNFRPSGLPP
jgi:hypothetical protein